MKIYPLLFLLLLFQLPAIAISIIIPSEPAPMGISYYGVNPDNSTYSLNTTAWLGIITIYDLLATNSFHLQPYTISFQLNTVLHYNWNGKTYALWIQNVAFYNTKTHEVWFEDSVWNFSLPPAELYVEGNGVVSCYNGQYFYSYGPNDKVNLTLPAAIYLLVNVSTQNQTVLHFYYNDGYGKWVNYDNVILEVQNISNVYFLVNGREYPPTGHYYATCLTMGGYAEDSTARIEQANVTMQLFYWNGYNWQEGVSAYNFDAITGETVSNVIDKLTFVNYEPAAVITSGSGNAGWLWTEKNVSILTIYTNVKKGYVLLFNSKGKYLNVSFINNLVNLTLEPSNYTVLLYSLGKIVGKTTVNLTRPYVSIAINEPTQSQTNTSTTSSSSTLTQSMQNTTVNQSTTQEHLNAFPSATTTIFSKRQVQLIVLIAVIITSIFVLLILIERKRR
mgnify:CR=1 FL=1